MVSNPLSKLGIIAFLCGRNKYKFVQLPVAVPPTAKIIFEHLVKVNTVRKKLLNIFELRNYAWK